ncbi:hypothetical protein HUK80_02015 [Flavobacterium sp. MAH-1]|uniref:Uncharacterized protein n=1 Tax=Flavobacterium agri TaxID=2743471 RepID=A0A7Y8XZN5_9FLAO|nr:hypothetical protein [Flavobacterium agri]NUY79656.1 hypothetical protein [Flavobacterium agri]NYA69681.1 hypothetical protein [Flavobacterium agri]
MTTEEYNNISMLYQFLTKRFDINQNYTSSDYHRCYHPNYYGVRGNGLEVLKRFEHLNFQDLYSEEYLKSQFYSQEYLTSKLVIIEENRVCVMPELGSILFYQLISMMKGGITEYLRQLKYIVENKIGIFRLSDDGDLLKFDLRSYENLLLKFEAIKDFNLFHHLFTKTNSNIIMLNWDNQVEIPIHEIEKFIAHIDHMTFR